jgi:hypothetical protein
MTEEEKEELRSLMYDNLEEPELDGDFPKTPVVNEPAKLGLELAGKFAMIKVDGQSVEVPSSAYVRSLEATVIDQSKQLLRLNSAVKMLRHALNGHSGDINELWREVERKLDMR